MEASDRAAEVFGAIEWPAPVRRVTLRWDGEQWRFVRETSVASMTLPAPDRLPDGERSRGFWVDTVTKDGRVVHREVMADPTMGMEHFDDEGGISRLSHPQHDVTIEVLVPDVADLAAVHIVANQPLGENDHDHGLQRSVVPLIDRDDSASGTETPPHHHGGPK